MTRTACVDTMVFVYGLLGEPAFGAESAAPLKHVERIVVPDSFRAEFVNALWRWVSHHRVDKADAREALKTARRLVNKAVRTDRLWKRALDLAVAHAHPAYDTLFVACAEREGVWLVTYDAKLLRLFPAVAVAPADFLASP